MEKRGKVSRSKGTTASSNGTSPEEGTRKGNTVGVGKGAFIDVNSGKKKGERSFGKLGSSGYKDHLGNGVVTKNSGGISSEKKGKI